MKEYEELFQAQIRYQELHERKTRLEVRYAECSRELERLSKDIDAIEAEADAAFKELMRLEGISL